MAFDRAVAAMTRSQRSTYRQGQEPDAPVGARRGFGGGVRPNRPPHILRQLGSFPARGMVKQWLKAGVVEDGRFAPTEEGTPQGGVISPVLLNVALHGMEQPPESATTRPAVELVGR